MDHDDSTAIPEIIFNDKWCVWYHHELNEWSVKGYRKIYNIANMEEFWLFFNNLKCLGGINKLHYFLMRDGITPIYEDIKNCRGGTWSSIVSLDSAENSYIELAQQLVGETMSDCPSDINGLSVNVKSGVSVIKIWNGDRSRSKTSRLCPIPNLQGQTIYKNHPKT
jgi:translation initiation factor 4E